MKLNKLDVFLTFITVVFSALLLYMFYLDVNMVTIRSGLKSFATISFKKNDAQRLFSDSYAWEKINNNAPLYDGDTIKTGYKSEASINFDDESKIDLGDNTIIKLKGASSQQSIEFVGGNISVKGSKGSQKNITIKTADGSVITLENNAGLNLLQIDNKLSVGVDSGNISIQKNGETKTIDMTQEFSIDTATGNLVIVQKEIFSISPLAEEKFIAFNANKKSINFVCESKKVTKEDIAYLDISSDAKFLKNVKTSIAKISDEKIIATQDVEQGTWFWRVRLKNDISSSARRFILYSDNKPKAVYPNKNINFSYRKKLPEIQFSWTPAENASAYFLQISKTPDFSDKKVDARVYSTNIKIGNLDSGEWFWRVLPIYSFLENSVVEDFDINSFTINQNSEMVKISTEMPFDNKYIELKTVEAEGILFSWNLNQEAVKYDLSIFDDESMSKILLSRKSSNSYQKIPGQELLSFLKFKKYFWSVRWQDSEGNFSEWAEAKSINVVDVAFSQRLSYPPDSYKISNTLIKNTRFTWKSNIPVKKYFQLSRDKDFKTINFQIEVSGDSILGKNWSEGDWYWRIRALNIDNSILADTPPRMFSIIGNLKEPEIFAPKNGESIALINNNESNFDWDPVENAVYYEVKIQKRDGSDYIYENSLVRESNLKINFNKYPTGNYILTVRGFIPEGDMTTAIYGLIKSVYFSTREIKPIILESPINNYVISGLDALRNGVNFRWNSEEPLGLSKVIISDDKYFKKIVYSNNNPNVRFNLSSLSKGRYYWAVSGRTTGGYDIDSKFVGVFYVEEIPLLPAPKIIFPADKQKLDFEFFTKNKEKTITFEWDAVSGATVYDYALYDNSNKVIFSAKGVKYLKYQYANISKLAKGKYLFSVTARNLDDNGNLMQKGNVSEAIFYIDLPNIPAPKFGDLRGLYGK